MSGLNLLYKFLLKEAAKGSGRASGILSIGGDVRKLADKKFQSYVMTAKKQGVDLDKLSEQEIKYMLQLNKPKGTTIGGHQVIDASSPEGQGITKDLFNMLDRQSGKNVIKTDFGGGITDIVTETITKIKTMEPIAGMKEANSVLARKGKYKNLTEEQSKKILKDTEDHIFERDIPIDPEDMADGGIAGMLGERTGFRGGGGYQGSSGRSKADDRSSSRQTANNDRQTGRSSNREQGIMSRGQGPQGTTKSTTTFDPGNTESDDRSTFQQTVNTLRQTAPERLPLHLRTERRKPPGKISRFFNNPVVRGGIWLANPALGGAMDARRAMQLKDLYGYTKNALSGDVYDEEDLTLNMITDQQKKEIDKAATMANRMNDTGKLTDIEKTQIFNDVKPFDDKGSEGGWFSDAKEPSPMTRQEYNAYVTEKGYAQGGRTGTGLNYLLGEDDQNSRVPFGGGGAGKPPITFTLTGGGSYGKNQNIMDQGQVIPGLNQEKYGYGFDLGANIDLPWGLSLEGGAGIGRGSTKTDYKGQPVDWMSDVGETKVGDKWNVGIKGKWPVNFNKMFMKDGGRTGFGLGGMGRRAFLKWMAGTGAGIGAAKSGLFSLLKGGGKKQVIKELTQVPINNIDGMPVWFKPLVNKVIKEGDDVTKKFADADRQIVHTTKLPNSQTDVIVTQDLSTGNVSVDIGMGKHGFKDGLHGQPVRLEYKAAEDIMRGPDMDDMHKVGVRDPHIKVKRRDEMTFDQKKHPDKAPEEFWVEEAEFTGGHPENVKFEDVSYEKFGEHGSNFDEVEKFATGKVKKTKTTESRVFGKKYLSEGDDMASGGRVPMWLGGGLTAGKGLTREMLKFMAKGSSHGKSPAEMLKMTNPKQFEKLLKDLSMYNKFSPETGIMAPDMIKNMIKKTKTDRTDMIEQLISSARSIKKGDDNIITYKNKIIEEMVSKGMDRKTAEEFAETLSKSLMKEVGPKQAGPKITEQGLLELENILKNLLTKDRQLQASGGRASLSAGGLAGMLGE